MGFQSLERSRGLPDDIGDIGTFVRVGLTQRGVGSMLFTATRTEAQRKKLQAINATIRADNIGGSRLLRPYGFRISPRQARGTTQGRHSCRSDQQDLLPKFKRLRLRISAHHLLRRYIEAGAVAVAVGAASTTLTGTMFTVLPTSLTSARSRRRQVNRILEFHNGAPPPQRMRRAQSSARRSVASDQPTTSVAGGNFGHMGSFGGGHMGGFGGGGHFHR